MDIMSVIIFQRGVGGRRAALSATHLPQGIAQTGRRIRVKDASLGWRNLTPASQQAWDQVVRVRVHRVPFDHAQQSTVNFTPLTEFPTRVVSYPNPAGMHSCRFVRKRAWVIENMQESASRLASLASLRGSVQQSTQKRL